MTILSADDKSHFTHIEDELFTPDVPKIYNSIMDLVTGIPTADAQTKIDGSPSCFIKIEEDGRAWVGTKSVFNKDPKLNYTFEDIERNHGHAPGLVEKLKQALTYLPKTIKKRGVIVQGDFMYSKREVQTRELNGKLHYIFKPNVVVNAIPVDSFMGKQITQSKIGFAYHTLYNDNGSRSGDVNSVIQPHADVFAMPVETPKLSDYTALTKRIESMNSVLARVSKDGLRVVSEPDMRSCMLQFINYCVKQRVTVNYQNLIQFFEELQTRKVDSLKTDASKEKAKQVFQDFLNRLFKNQKAIESVLNAHQLIANLKNDIITELDKAQPILRFYSDNELRELEVANPEGYVIYNRFGTSKFVNRGEFSFRNFLREAFDTDAKMLQEKLEGNKTAVALLLGRFQPPHIEHLNLVHAIRSAAKTRNADALIFISNKVDNKTNPLTADERIEILQRMAGEKIFYKSGNMFDSLALLDKKYTHLIIVSGDDRMDDVRRARQYNNKDFHFKTIEVLTRHDIINTRSAAGGDGIHASDMRKWALEGNFDNFRYCMPRTISDASVRNIMKKIKARLS